MQQEMEGIELALREHAVTLDARLGRVRSFDDATVMWSSLVAACVPSVVIGRLETCWQVPGCCAIGCRWARWLTSSSMARSSAWSERRAKASP